MLEKPNISEEQIISRIQAEYGLRVAALTFLPLGADMSTAVYRVVAQDAAPYFLKLRKGFKAITVDVPFFLHSQGVQKIIPPVATVANSYWASFGEHTMVLYPFIEGKDGFDREVTEDQKRRLGAALQKIHTLQLPAELEARIPREEYSSYWRERMKDFQQQAEQASFQDPTAASLAEFIRSKQSEISFLIQRAGQLASSLASRPLEFVLCHTDIHGANILITDSDELYIVDWDNPLLAPKERDLMFIGGGIDTLWNSPHDEAIFYEGYGETKIDYAVMAYYRYERIVEDLVAYCEQLWLTDEGGADREPAYRTFLYNFKPGATIDIAKRTDRLAVQQEGKH